VKIFLKILAVAAFFLLVRAGSAPGDASAAAVATVQATTAPRPTTRAQVVIRVSRTEVTNTVRAALNGFYRNLSNVRISVVNGRINTSMIMTTGAGRKHSVAFAIRVRLSGSQVVAQVDTTTLLLDNKRQSTTDNYSPLNQSISSSFTRSVTRKLPRGYKLSSVSLAGGELRAVAVR
jgi:hypothetical protein